MGIDYNVYVGPYALCQNELVDKETTRLSCPNKDCCRYNRRPLDKQKFCTQCGTKISEIPTTIKQLRVKSWEMFDDLQEHLWLLGDDFKDTPEHSEIWRSNMKGIGKRFDPKYDEYVRPLGVCDPEMDELQEIAAFEEQAAESLKQLREAYGEDNVKITWGIIGWMS